MTALLAACFGTLAAANDVRSQNVGVRVQNPAAGSRQSAVGDGIDAITIPQMVNYQGKLTDTAGRAVRDSSYGVTFRLYGQPTGGTEFWSETETVQTHGGLFSVLLGSVAPIFFADDGNSYLGMQVGAAQELTPRVRVVSTAYAYMAERAATADSARPSGQAYGDLVGYFPSPTIGTGKVNSDKVQDNSLRGADFKTPCSLYCQSGNPNAALWVKSSNTGNGIRVDSAANNGIVVYFANSTGILVDSSAGNGINVYGANTDGIYVASAGVRGVRVDNAGQWGVASYGNLGGGFFKADVATGVGIEADAYNNVATDTAVRAHGRGYATGGWYTGDLAGGKSAPCVVSSEQAILAHGSARLAGGKAAVVFPAVFTENARSDVPVQVTLTPVGNPAGLLCVTAKDASGFSTMLKNVPGWSGETDVTFDWVAIGTLREPETSAEAKAEQEREDRERAAARLRLARERQE
jgi:hypothetical protein